MENETLGKKSKAVPILTGLLILLLAAAVILLVVMLLKKNSGENPALSGSSTKYESNVILDDPDSLQKAVDEMMRKAAEGQMALEMKVEAASSDGENFSCYLANSVQNSYDLFLELYLDETGEELYRSGIIPIGGRIETFTTARQLEKGAYVCTLVYNQVEEDGETVHAKVNVELTLIVS